MIKKISSGFLILFFLLPSFVFAQASSSSVLAPIQIDEKISMGLEEFFEKTVNKDYESAYGMMSDDFIKSTHLEDFKLILSETGLTTFTRKTWTSFKKEMFGVLALVDGDFMVANGEIHHIKFDIFVDAHAIKIRSILESITLADLKKRFPPRGEVLALVQENLHELATGITKNNPNDVFALLSPHAKEIISIGAIRKILRQFKKQKYDMSLPPNASIQVSRIYPALNGKGLMIVKGSYKNDKNKIIFSLSYNYEWRWGLIGFSFKARPLN